MPCRPDTLVTRHSNPPRYRYCWRIVLRICCSCFRWKSITRFVYRFWGIHFFRCRMYMCPTCNALSISLFRKWLSYPALPAYCSSCRSYSHAHRSSGGVGIVVSAFVITGFGFAASALNAVWPLLLGISSALAFYIWHLHRIQLEKLSPELVSKARKTESMSGILLLIAFFLN